MFLRVLALASVVSVFGVGCGGGEVPEGAEGVSQPEQSSSSELVSTCESLQGKTCSPEREIGCTWTSGAPGECYCQNIPFNKWVCWVS
ncbi:hypothetical protein [Pyxidicoccus trucidator]|uniref:hypothetical protein n=1 Tax=Pyxidicoccus trucidator TaxID=2709662 RepID=UPI0013DA070D|nr:hypothetical protein [Pyxidicoccus trucidator]